MYYYENNVYDDENDIIRELNEKNNSSPCKKSKKIKKQKNIKEVSYTSNKSDNSDYFSKWMKNMSSEKNLNEISGKAISTVGSAAWRAAQALGRGAKAVVTPMYTKHPASTVAAGAGAATYGAYKAGLIGADKLKVSDIDINGDEGLLKQVKALVNAGTRVQDAQRMVAEAELARIQAAEAASRTPSAVSRAFSDISSRVTPVLQATGSEIRKRAEQAKKYAKEHKKEVVVGGTATAALGSIVAAEIIRNILRNAKYRDEGCDDLEGYKRKECKKYVKKYTINKLRQNLSRCQHSNDPKKCVEDMTAKIEEIKKQNIKD